MVLSFPDDGGLARFEVLLHHREQAGPGAAFAEGIKDGVFVYLGLRGQFLGVAPVIQDAPFFNQSFINLHGVDFIEL